ESLNVRGELIDGLRGGQVSAEPSIDAPTESLEPGMALLTEPTEEVDLKVADDFRNGGLTVEGAVQDPAMETVDEFFLPPPRDIIGDLAELPPEEEERIRQEALSEGGAHPKLDCFQGYVTYAEEEGRIVFGLPRESTLVDLHAYRDTGEVLDAYTAFVMDKEREGFELQSELQGDLPGIGAHPIDLECLQKALEACAPSA
ncbi:MAG: hypothetical protein VX519_01540, partial [Myxococcota bacterium]|nr:hypothetical protein [Myxococcota bacterium]